MGMNTGVSVLADGVRTPLGSCCSGKGAYWAEEPVLERETIEQSGLAW